MAEPFYYLSDPFYSHHGAETKSTKIE